MESLKNRLRWKSRRGWLELDLLLDRFWQQHGDGLSPPELSTLADWLAHDDETLWRLLKNPPPQTAAMALAKKFHYKKKGNNDGKNAQTTKGGA